jgi:hypothetical protein
MEEDFIISMRELNYASNNNINLNGSFYEGEFENGRIIRNIGKCGKGYYHNIIEENSVNYCDQPTTTIGKCSLLKVVI